MDDKKIVDYRSPEAVSEPALRKIRRGRYLLVASAFLGAVSCRASVFVHAHRGDFGFLLVVPPWIASMFGLGLGLAGCFIMVRFRQRTDTNEQYPLVTQLLVLLMITTLILSAAAFAASSLEMLLPPPPGDF